MRPFVLAAALGAGLVTACAPNAPVAKDRAATIPRPDSAGVREPIAPASREPGIVGEFLDRKSRWAVKTGADEDAGRVRLDRPVRTTVDALTRLPRPERIDPDRRSAGPETTLYEVEVEIVAHKIERADRDVHVVVRDPGGDPRRTLVVEFPDPAVVSNRSPFRAGIAEARATLERAYRLRSSFRGGGGRRAVLRGIGFFDDLHGQRGMAANGIELHPIVSLRMVGSGSRDRYRMRRSLARTAAPPRTSILRTPSPS